MHACLTSSKALLLWAKCSGCCRSKTQATSILGLPEMVVCPEISLCVPILSVLEIPSAVVDCAAIVKYYIEWLTISNLFLTN